MNAAAVNGWHFSLIWHKNALFWVLGISTWSSCLTFEFVMSAYVIDLWGSWTISSYKWTASSKSFIKSLSDLDVDAQRFQKILTMEGKINIEDNGKQKNQ